MKIRLSFNFSGQHNNVRKIEIHRFLSTKKYKQYFYRVSGLGAIPQSYFEQIVAKIKTIWKILFSRIDPTIAYSLYLSEVMHKTHMKSLLEKEIKLKCLGIVPDEEMLLATTPQDLNLLKHRAEEATNYNDQMSEYLQDNVAFQTLQDSETQLKLDRMQLYVESNNITEESRNADKYIQLVSTLRTRDED